MTLADQLLKLKYALMNPSIIRFSRELDRHLTVSPDELEALQFNKYRDLVQYAYRNVPFYRTRFHEHGFHPDQLRSRDDLFRIPILTRTHLRDQLSQITASGIPPRRLKRSTTGGTTGKPVETYLDRRVPHAALGWRMLSWWGFGPAVNMGVVWREPGEGGLRRFAGRVRNWPVKQVRLDASQITAKKMDHFVRACNHKDIPILHGYTGALLHLARHVEKSGSPWRPRLVWATCAPLSAPQRMYLGSVFNAPVLDQYGSCEVYWIGGQCPESGRNLHVFSDSRHIEIVNGSHSPCPVGEVGEMLVTDLENRAFPIIRYAIGDRGRLLKEKCSCGISLPLMAPVQGKTVDVIHLPDGTAITDMNVIFDRYPSTVRGFQVHQDREGKLEIRYIPCGPSIHTRMALIHIQKEMEKTIRNQVPVSFKAVTDIPHQNGKLQYIFSEYRQPDQ